MELCRRDFGSGPQYFFNPGYGPAGKLPGRDQLHSGKCSLVFSGLFSEKLLCIERFPVAESSVYIADETEKLPSDDSID